MPVGAKRVIAADCLVVCGESPTDIFTAADFCLNGWQTEDLSWGFREFYFRKYSAGDRELNVLVGGLGSASVELILQEASLAGATRFLLTGSCAALGGSMPVGSLFLPTSCHLRPGAFFEYDSSKKTAFAQTRMQESLRAYLSSVGQSFREGSVISTDAFYGIGGSYDTLKNPSYAGARSRLNQKPESLPLALSNPLSATALDMECATFFALGEWLSGVEVAAFKTVSNAIPWDDGFDPAIISKSVRDAVQLGLNFLTSPA